MGQIVTRFVNLPVTILRREDSLKGENPWNCQFSSIFEAISDIWHEFGHNLGLSHDGTTTGTTYYGGHGSGLVSWAPIMGNSYYNSMGQYFINGSVQPAAPDETAPTPDPMGWANQTAAISHTAINMTATTATTNSAE